MKDVVCVLGHTRQAMECPACAEEAGDVPSLEHWRWYRNRTSSKRVTHPTHQPHQRRPHAPLGSLDVRLLAEAALVAFVIVAALGLASGRSSRRR
jgi:hypothetical protein